MSLKPDWKFRGYIEEASATLARAEAGSGVLSDDQHTFLSEGFPEARDRMTTLGSTVGTAGSFLLVLVALLVGFATKSQDLSDRLVRATTSVQQQVMGCSSKAANAACDEIKLANAQADLDRASARVNEMGDLNRFQAVTGGLVVLGFLLGLAALLTNPVPGPDARKKDAAGIAAWHRALDRLKTRRHWIEVSLVAQLLAVVSISILGVNVLTG